MKPLAINSKVFSKKWTNMKTYAKRKSSELKVAQKRTGGGPPPPPLDSETEGVLSIINHETEVECPFDSESAAVVVEEQLSTQDFQIFEVQNDTHEIRLTIS